MAFDQESSYSSLFTLLSLLSPLDSHSDSIFYLWSCKLHWMRVSWLPLDFKFGFLRGSVICSPLRVLVSSYWGLLKIILASVCSRRAGLKSLVSLSRINTLPWKDLLDPQASFSEEALFRKGLIGQALLEGPMRLRGTG